MPLVGDITKSEIDEPTAHAHKCETGLSWSWFVDLKSSQSLLIWWLEIHHRKGSGGRYELFLDGFSAGLTVRWRLVLEKWDKDEDEHFRPSLRPLILGIKIRGFFGDYCIRTRCPTIKTRHVELLFIYSTFCSTLCVLTLCCIGRVAVHLSHLRKDLVLPC